MAAGCPVHIAVLLVALVSLLGVMKQVGSVSLYNRDGIEAFTPRPSFKTIVTGGFLKTPGCTAEDDTVPNHRSNRSLIYRPRSVASHTWSNTYRRFFGTTSRTSLTGDGTPEDHHHARLGEYAASLWKQNAMTDVLVVVAEKEFKAHKAVLACYSPYFKEVLLKPGSKNVHYLEIPCVTPQAFNILLSYMYTGELHVTCQDLADVYRAARRLGMTDAIGKCLELLTVSSRCIENTIHLFVTAKKLDLLEPSVRAFRLMLSHFETLVGSKEFLDLEVDQVVDFFSADEIGARSEVIVYLAALYWLDHKFLDRERHIDEVMACVRFPLMDLDEVLMCHHPPLLPGIIRYPKVREALYNATCYVAARTLQQEEYFNELSCKPRKFLLTGQPSVSWDFQSLYNPKLYPFYRDTKAATKIQAAYRGYVTRKRVSMELSRRHRAASVIQATYRGYRVRRRLKEQPAKQVYDTYPFQDRHIAWELPTRDVVRRATTPLVSEWGSRAADAESAYILSDVGSDTMLPVSEKSSQISLLSKVCYENVIYVVGAFRPRRRKAEQPSNVLLSYSRSGKVWKELDHLPEPRQNVLLVVLGGFLYCIGGCEVKILEGANRVMPRKECFRYHIQTREWIPMASLKTGRMFHGVATHEGLIYAVGGKDFRSRTLASVECYSPSSNRWADVTPMSIPRMGMGTAECNGMLWMVGGITGQENHLVLVDLVECFDPTNNRRFRKASLPFPIAFAPLVKCQGKMFLIGGAYHPSEDSPELASLANVHVYEESSGSWKVATTLPKPLHSVIASSLGEDIYVLGGYSAQEQRALDEVFYYDSVQRRWRTCCPLPPSVGGYVLAAVGYEAGK